MASRSPHSQLYRCQEARRESCMREKAIVYSRDRREGIKARSQIILY